MQLIGERTKAWVETERPTPLQTTSSTTLAATSTAARPRAASNAHFSRELSRSPIFGTQHGYDGQVRSGGARRRGGGRERVYELSKRKHKTPVTPAEVHAAVSVTRNHWNERKRCYNNTKDFVALYDDSCNKKRRVSGSNSDGGHRGGRSVDRSSRRVRTSESSSSRSVWRLREVKGRTRFRSLSNNRRRTTATRYHHQQQHRSSRRSVSVSRKDKKRGNGRDDDDDRERGRVSSYSSSSYRPRHQSRRRDRRDRTRTPSPRRRDRTSNNNIKHDSSHSSKRRDSSHGITRRETGASRNNSTGRGNSSSNRRRQDSPRRRGRSMSRHSEKEQRNTRSNSSRHDSHRYRSLGRQGTPATASIAGSSMASSRRSSRDRDQAQRHRSRFASRSPSCSAYSGSGSGDWSNDENEDEDEGEVVTISGRGKLYPDEAARVGLAHGILELEYWDRTDECHQRKRKHLDSLDDSSETREETIFRTTLKDLDVAVEPNMFAYETPDDVLHYTFWSRKDATNEEVEKAVEKWIEEEKPEVIEWDFDLSNLEDGLSIEIYHVHVFFRVVKTSSTSMSCVDESLVLEKQNGGGD